MREASRAGRFFGCERGRLDKASGIVSQAAAAQVGRPSVCWLDAQAARAVLAMPPQPFRGQGIACVLLGTSGPVRSRRLCGFFDCLRPSAWCWAVQGRLSGARSPQVPPNPQSHACVCLVSCSRFPNFVFCVFFNRPCDAPFRQHEHARGRPSHQPIRRSVKPGFPSRRRRHSVQRRIPCGAWHGEAPTCPIGPGPYRGRVGATADTCAVIQDAGCAVKAL